MNKSISEERIKKASPLFTANFNFHSPMDS